MSDAQRINNVPVPPAADFNRITAKVLKSKNALVWEDANKDGVPNPGELKGKALSTYVATTEGGAKFTPKFNSLFANVTEQFRRESVTKELTYTYRKTITTDLVAALKGMPQSLNITDAEIALYQRATAKLLEVAPLMQAAFEEQAGFTPEMKTAPMTANDKELVSRYGHPWCISDTHDTCSALPNFAAHESGVLASGIDCKELGDKLTGPSGPFSAVTKVDGKLVTTPYSVRFAKYQVPSQAKLLETAAIFDQIPREKVMAKYLRELAAAFGNPAPFPFEKSDAAWMEHQTSDSIFFARIGPDENGALGAGDPCGAKAVFHFSIGLKYSASAELSDQYKPYLQKWENRIAELVGDPKLYKAQQVNVRMPDLINIIYQNGDDTGGPNGTAVGQTLPNWCGPDGEASPCARRIMIYTSKSDAAYSRDLMEKYVLPLFTPSLRGEFRTGKTGYKGTVVHELTHNLGPQSGKTNPVTGKDYQAALGVWKGAFEEMKAQMGSLYFPSMLITEKRAEAKAGKLSQADLAMAEQDYRQEMISDLAWALRHISRATHSLKFEGKSPYSRLAAVQVGYLAEQGAMNFDPKTKTWNVDFQKLPAATESLMKIVATQYAKGDFNETDAFMKHYLEGAGFQQLHVARLQEVAGKAPSVNLSYQVNGLGTTLVKDKNAPAPSRSSSKLD